MNPHFLLGLFFSCLLSACAQQAPRANLDLEHAAAQYVTLGLAYLNRNQPALAKSRFDKALTLAPEHARAHDGLGLYYQRIGQLNLAQQSLTRALAFNSKLTLARHHLGRVLLLCEREGEAIEVLQYALNDEHYTHKDDLYADLASAYFMQGHSSRAMASYQRALANNPKHHQALLSLSALWLERGDALKAKGYLERFDREVRLHRAVYQKDSAKQGFLIAKRLGNTDGMAYYQTVLASLQQEAP